jgi:hypothetical protein
MKTLLLGLAALFMLASCTPGVSRQDPVVPLVVEGCKIERYVVIPDKNGSQESVYIARCAPTQTTSITSQYKCGRSCTKNVTTITTIEGTPEPGAAEIPR